MRPDPLFARAELALNECCTLRAEQRRLQSEREHIRQALRRAVLECAMERSEALARRQDRGPDGILVMHRGGAG